MDNDSQQIKIKFEIDGHELDATALSDFLRNFEGLSNALGSRLTPQSKIGLKVRTPEPGSFLIDLVVVAHQVGILQSAGLVAAAQLISTGIDQVMKIRQFLKRSKPKSVSQIGNGCVVIVNGDNNQITIQKDVYEAYSKDPDVPVQINGVLSAAKLDPNVKALKIGTVSPTEGVIISREELDDLIVPQDEPGALGIQMREDANLFIVKVSFEADLKWQFVYEGQKIGARISDKSFNEQVEKNREPFRKGDRLIADLGIKPTFNKKLGVHINEFEVLRVKRHIEAAGHEKLM